MIDPAKVVGGGYGNYKPPLRQLNLKIRTVATAGIWDLEDRESYHEIIPQPDGTYTLKETFVLEDDDWERKTVYSHMTEQDELSFKRAIIYLSEEEKKRLTITSPDYEEKRAALAKSHWSYFAEASGKFLIGHENRLIELNDDGSPPDHAKYSLEDLARAKQRHTESPFHLVPSLPTPANETLPAVQNDFRRSAFLDWIKTILINRKRKKLFQKLEDGGFDYQPFRKLQLELGNKHDSEIFQDDLLFQIFEKGITENDENPHPTKYTWIIKDLRCFKDLISGNPLVQEKFRDFINQYLIEKTRNPSSCSTEQSAPGLIRQMEETALLESYVMESTKLRVAAIILAKNGSLAMGGTTLQFLTSLNYPDNFRDLIIEEAPEFSNANGTEIALRNYEAAMKDIESAHERAGAHQLPDTRITIFQIPNPDHPEVKKKIDHDKWMSPHHHMRAG